jgi:environmental stress-induced protein Ves
MVHLLTPADFHPMPWKNGAGRTTEIAVHPAGAALDAFDWRVSIADVERDGPFSRFPGIDRTIVLLEGGGMRLRSARGEIELTTPCVPHEMSGDDAVECTLAAGPCRDFNAMFRRGRARGRITVVRDDGSTDIGPAPFRLAYAVAGPHECTLPGHPVVRLEEGHALLVDSFADHHGPIAIRPLKTGAVALVVSIEGA